MQLLNKIDVLSKVSPQQKAVIEKTNELAGDAFSTDVSLDEMRANYVKERAFWNQGGPQMARTQDIIILSYDGTPVPVRLYTPEGAAESAPVIQYIHGGGYTLGSPDTHDRITRILADQTKAVVASVDYPLSPEAKFPTAILCCAAVAEHLHKHGAEYGIDGNDLSFAGDSGGASLSMGTFLYLREERHDASYVRSMLLYYGMFGLKDSVSQRLLGGAWDGLLETDMAFYMQAYCANPAEDMQSIYVNVLDADLSKNVPPCYLAAAEFDPLRDDTAALHLIFQEHGTPHEYKVFPGVIHAFLHNSRMLDAAQEALEEGAAFFVNHRARA